jgi:hypothetical protein
MSERRVDRIGAGASDLSRRGSLLYATVPLLVASALAGCSSGRGSPEAPGAGGTAPPQPSAHAERDIETTVTLERITPGARVLLVRTESGTKTAEKVVPEVFWTFPPVKINIPRGERWTLVASKDGYVDFVRELSFEVGGRHPTIRIELAKKPGPAP